jgi:hypothetical protein
MKTIHKFPLDVIDDQPFEMPIGAKVLCVQVQNGLPCIWAEVNTEVPKENRWFSVYGTGAELAAFDHTYIGTFQLRDGQLVFHVYENHI